MVYIAFKLSSPIMSANTLFEHFSSVDDPRQQGKMQHLLFDFLFLTISAVLAGCQGGRKLKVLPMTN
ncbi:transposase family protein [Pseudoalteromonas luteoviolacea]|uniref:transposase family protein n=1 Tax=Pseudoalteromonas luteoviolacea TaxID=43657 RepID=UPI00114E1E4D|nr:transposase family protein [Pseudoalteromonas luteoviolacea]